VNGGLRRQPVDSVVYHAKADVRGRKKEREKGE